MLYPLERLGRSGLDGVTAVGRFGVFLGQALFCALLGILVMIASTSSLTLIPVLYWSIAGLAQAYARAPALARAGAPAPRLAPHDVGEINSARS